MPVRSREVGSEQGKVRPVLVISQTPLNKLLPVVNVLPLTSRKPGRRVYPNETAIPAGSGNLPNNPSLSRFQIRTLDKKRLVKFIGNLDEPVQREQIVEALCFQLEIQR